MLLVVKTLEVGMVEYEAPKLEVVGSLTELTLEKGSHVDRVVLQN